MEVVYRRCCGIDIHKDFITACVLVNEPGKQREVRKKEFRTYLRIPGHVNNRSGVM